MLKNILFRNELNVCTVKDCNYNIVEKCFQMKREFSDHNNVMIILRVGVHIKGVVYLYNALFIQ